MARNPWLAIPLVAGLLIGFGALLRLVNDRRVRRTDRPRRTGDSASYVPLYVHLAIVFAAGIYLPAALVHWFQAIAVLLG